MLHNEDCLITMSRIPDGHFDAVITSPPYNMNLRIRNGAYCSRQITQEFSTKYAGFADNVPLDEYEDFHGRVLRELIRTSKRVFYNIAIVTGSKRAFFSLIGQHKDYLKDIIVWDKGHGQPAMAGGVLNRASELILVFEQPEHAISRQFSDVNFDRGALSDIWRVSRERSKSKLHGAVFPEALVEIIVRNFTRQGDLIYDPFMGTGTTGVVANRLGRRFMGSELVPRYYEFACERLGVERPAGLPLLFDI